MYGSFQYSKHVVSIINLTYERVHGRKYLLMFSFRYNNDARFGKFTSGEEEESEGFCYCYHEIWGNFLELDVITSDFTI